MNKFIKYCSEGRLDIIQQMITNCPNINIHKNRECAFIEACKNGHLNVVKYLCNLYKTDKKYKPIDIHVYDNKSFKLAYENNHIHIMEYLLNLHKQKPYSKLRFNFNEIYSYIISMSLFNSIIHEIDQISYDHLNNIRLNPKTDYNFFHYISTYYALKAEKHIYNLIHSKPSDENDCCCNPYFDLYKQSKSLELLEEYEYVNKMHGYHFREMAHLFIAYNQICKLQLIIKLYKKIYGIETFHGNWTVHVNYKNIYKYLINLGINFNLSPYRYKHGTVMPPYPNKSKPVSESVSESESESESEFDVFYYKTYSRLKKEKLQFLCI